MSGTRTSRAGARLSAVAALAAATLVVTTAASQASPAPNFVAAPSRPLPFDIPGPVTVPSSAAATGSAATVGAVQPRLASSIRVTVALSAAWRVTTVKRLVLADGAMTCRPVSLVRRGTKPATAVSIQCTGPIGSPGLTYALTVRITKVPKVVLRVSVRFPQPVFPTAAALTKVAPLPPMPGTMISVAGVNFLQPQGWIRTDFTGVTKIADPKGGCDVYVVNPVLPDLSGADASHSLQTQLYDITSALFAPTPVTGSGGVDPYFSRIVGQNGNGFPWVGLELQVNSGIDAVSIRPYMVVFGSNFAVPVVQVGLACDHGFRDAPTTLAIFDTMNVPGSRPTLNAYTDGKGGNDVVGEWSGTGGSVTCLDAYAANRHYIEVCGFNVVLNLNGVLYNAFKSWPGDGNYAVVGPYLATFPSAAWRHPSSTMISIYDNTVGDTSTGFTTYHEFCSTSTSDGSTAEGCARRL